MSEATQARIGQRTTIVRPSGSRRACLGEWSTGAYGPALGQFRLVAQRPRGASFPTGGAPAAGADGLILLPQFLGEETLSHHSYARGTLVGLGLHPRWV